VRREARPNTEKVDNSDHNLEMVVIELQRDKDPIRKEGTDKGGSDKKSLGSGIMGKKFGTKVQLERVGKKDGDVG
jgi:hypothetical protein